MGFNLSKSNEQGSRITEAMDRAGSGLTAPASSDLKSSQNSESTASSLRMPAQTCISLIQASLPSQSILQ